MSSYFYVTILGVILFLNIVYEIYLFTKGRYYPYLNWNKKDSFKKRIFDIGSLIVVWISTFIMFLSPATEIPSFISLIILLLLIVSVFCISILNYLSYVKIKDPKIIHQTVILDLALIVFLFFVNYKKY